MSGRRAYRVFTPNLTFEGSLPVIMVTSSLLVTPLHTSGSESMLTAIFLSDAEGECRSLTLEKNSESCSIANRICCAYHAYQFRVPGHAKK